ncbi:MAG: AI-2E family transporter [Spirochaetota bacterium]
MTQNSSGKQPDLGRIFTLTLLIGILLIFLYMIRGYLVALMLAAITAALFMPMHQGMTRLIKGHARLSSLLVMIIALLIIGVPLVGFLLLAANEAVKVANTLGPIISSTIRDSSNVINDLTDTLPFLGQLEPYADSLASNIRSTLASLGSMVFGSITSITKGTFSAALNLFIFIYALYYFLNHGSGFLEAAKNYIPLERKDSDMLVDHSYLVIRASLKSILIIGVLQGALISLAFWITGIEGAAFWGTVVVVLSAIPGIGAPIVWVPAAISLFLQGQIGWAIALTAWGMIVVGLIDNILRPYVVGREAKLPDLLILVGVLGGIAMFGPTGILIGPVIVSLTAAAFKIYGQMYATQLD